MISSRQQDQPPDTSATESGTKQVASGPRDRSRGNRRNLNVVMFAQNSPTEFSGGRYHSWMMAEAMAHAGHRVSYVTNNLPVFYGDFTAFPHHRDVRLCVLRGLGDKRLDPSGRGRLNLRETAVDELLAESGRWLFNEETLGIELAPDDTAASDTRREVAAEGVYQPTYAADLTICDSSLEPGSPGAGRYCLRIVSNGTERAGIQHGEGRFELRGDRRYLLTCKVYCPSNQTAFRLGVKSDRHGHLWAKDLRTGSIDFANRGGAWTAMTGMLTVPAGDPAPAHAWIMHWDRRPLTWYLDDISIREVVEEFDDEHGALQFHAGGPAGQNLPQPDVLARHEDRKKQLVICPPFTPDQASDAAPVSFCFVDLESIESADIESVASNYARVCIEKSVAEAWKRAGHAHPEPWQEVAPIVEQRELGDASPRLLLLVSNDTHVHTLARIARHFKHTLFVIPARDRKDEGAATRLQAEGFEFVEIDYDDRDKPEIETFAPDIVLCGNDWTSEFNAVHAIAKKLDIPCVALQEGPQDWDQKIKGVDPRKFRNAEVLFSQGAVTLKHIRPKYFTITGHPKTDHIEEHPLPSSPRVFINCNFTYGQYEEARAAWMEDVLSVCKELEIEYLISRHPRDPSRWDDPNFMPSDPFKVADQLRSCSIVVSRFSNIPYEAVAAGRSAVYYNPHAEPMKTFGDDESDGVLKANDRGSLRKILQRHQSSPHFDREAAGRFMRLHCGPTDGRSIERIAAGIRRIHASRFIGHRHLENFAQEGPDADEGPLFSVVICTHNRAPMLDRAVRSVLLNPLGEIHYELIIVDNASTDQTPAVMEPYIRRGRVRYLREERLGLSVARNTGWRNARGEFVVFLDDDGEVAPGWLRAFLDVFETRPGAVACGGRIVPRYERDRPDWFDQGTERFFGQFSLGDDVIRCDWVPGGNAAWRRGALESLGGFDTRFGRVGGSPTLGSEESALIQRAVSRGGVLYYSPHAVMVHHINAARMNLLWLSRRYWGQGVTSSRWQSVFGQMSHSGRLALGFGLKSVGEAFGAAGGVIGGLARGRGRKAVTKWFELLHRCGQAGEATRFGLGRLRDRWWSSNHHAEPGDLETPPDLVVMAPNNDKRPYFYDDVVDFARVQGARLMLLNFETPNWFNALSPVKRDPALWDNWRRHGADWDIVLSSAAESTTHARPFFEDCSPRARHEHCYPSINTVVADRIGELERERRVVLLTRFSRAEHKGSNRLAELPCEALRGYTLVIIVGTGQVPPEAAGELAERAAHYGIELDFKYRLSDHEKFRQIKRARLMLFPSFFEGFGLPPVEALYCGTPCVAFDLPVLREVSGEGLVYVPPGDWGAFRESIADVLTRPPDPQALRRRIERTARFEAYSERIDRLLEAVGTGRG